MSGMFGILKISGTGLSAQRKKLNAIAQNIANVETTRTPEGGPYKAKRVIFKEDSSSGSFTSSMNKAISRLARTNSRHLSGGNVSSLRVYDAPGVEAKEVELDTDNFKMVYDPSHPDSDDNGYVAMPNINIIAEMVDMMTASRAYEANISISLAAKSMFKEALNI